MTEIQRNNPLHGVKLEALLTELVDYYGWEAMAAEFNFNCFKSNPSVKSSLKFLRKTPWAREKVEAFFLYHFKGLPRPPEQEEEISPRDRIIPLTQQPGQPRAIRPRPQQNRAEQDRSRPHQSRPNQSRPDRSGTGRAGSADHRANSSRQRPQAGQESGDVWGHWRK